MKTDSIGSICVVTPETKQLDATNAENFGRELDETLTGHKKYVLDLSSVGFIDSSGLGKIVAALRNTKKQDCQMVICGAAQAVQVLFDMVRLKQIAKIFPSRNEAVAFLNSEP